MRIFAAPGSEFPRHRQKDTTANGTTTPLGLSIASTPPV
jgi:hypothetical protein